MSAFEAETEQLRLENERLAKVHLEQMHCLEREHQATQHVLQTAFDTKCEAMENAMQDKVAEANARVIRITQEHEKVVDTMEKNFRSELNSMRDMCRELEDKLMAEHHHVEDAVFAGQERQRELETKLTMTHKSRMALLEDQVAQLTLALHQKESAYDEVLSQQNDDELVHMATLEATITSGKGTFDDETTSSHPYPPHPQDPHESQISWNSRDHFDS